MCIIAVWWRRRPSPLMYLTARMAAASCRRSTKYLATYRAHSCVRDDGHFKAGGVMRHADRGAVTSEFCLSKNVAQGRRHALGVGGNAIYRRPMTVACSIDGNGGEETLAASRGENRGAIARAGRIGGLSNAVLVCNLADMSGYCCVRSWHAAKTRRASRSHHRSPEISISRRSPKRLSSSRRTRRPCPANRGLCRRSRHQACKIEP